VIAADSGEVSAYQASDYFSRPFLAENSSQKIILVHIDQSYDMLERAYSTPVFDKDSTDGHIGYFDATKQYRYRHKEQYFEYDNALKRGQKDAWDGQFLNWLLMRKLDMAHLLLLGLHAQKNSDPVKLASNTYSIETKIIRDPQSRRYSPIPGFIPITINNGKLEYQGKTLQLRIKETRAEKGLVNLLTPNIQLYFYAHKTLNLAGKQKFTFGQSDELTMFLTQWSPNQEKLSKQQYHAAYFNSLQRALENIKTLTLKNKSEILCQRYVHLDMPHSIYNTLTFKDEFLTDCQAKIKEKQALTSFQWSHLAEAENNAQRRYSQRSKFAYSEKDRLLKAMFHRLFYESQSKAYQVSGADIDTFSDGVAVLYQSLSRYSLDNGSEKINWLGDLSALLIDKQGRLRSDNGDKKLGSVSEDPLVFSCFDGRDKQLRFRFLSKHAPEAKCNSLNYPYLEDDVGYLWRAADVLNNVLEDDISRQRLPFQSRGNQRYIRTHIDQEEFDFVAGSSYPLKPEWLDMSAEKEFDNLVNYVRGEDQDKARERHIDKSRFLLGDTLRSAPVVVGKPTANYHLLYGDYSYQIFLKQYQYRRSRVFVGSNDGMLHSFNAGWYDAKKQQLNITPKYASAWELGQEIWAFVPYSVLPYLNEQRDKFYGISPEHHLRLFTQKPYIFDAKVFGKNALKGQPDRAFYYEGGNQVSGETHPGGWGTLMVVGAGLGGSETGSFQPSYLVFDITDAEQAPKFLASIKAPNMGSAISLPSVMTQRNQQGDIEWRLVIGSGTNLDPQSVKQKNSTRSSGIYSYNLKNLAAKPSVFLPTYIDLKAPSSYVSGIASADWDLNGETDALYINIASNKNSQKNTAQQRGRLYRINIRNKLSQQLEMKAEKIFETTLALSARPQLSLDMLDNRWIYLATSQSAKGNTLIMADNKIIGIKEPRNVVGQFLVESPSGRSGLVAESDLLDVSDILVSSDDGELSGAWNLQPKLAEPTVFALEQRLLNFSESKTYTSGWLRRLDKYEIPNSTSKLFGGILTQATYQSAYLNCQLSNEASIHRLRFTTGTAWYTKQVQTDKNNKKTGRLQDTKMPSDGSDMVSSILLHRQGANIRQLQSSKNGKTQTTQEADRHVPVSAEISWREL
tara:strand:+ start:14261 stop:17653 length:3393 start_codon:yes stop_codon:yes gene_type:complete